MVEQEENAAHSRDDVPSLDAVVRKRVQSDIEFPYADLEVASQLAIELHKNAGGRAGDAELAGWLNQSSNGGTYRARRSAARMFGLIDLSQGSVILTPLGSELADDAKSRSARIEAFLKPALFAQMYERCKGNVLPPPAAIERMMEQLGVSPKQKDRARQAFQKSAAYAGYIDTATGRFIKPGNGHSSRHDEQTSDRPKSGGGSGGGNGPDDPLIAALIQKLPKDGSWSAADRAVWLRMAVMAFDLAYGRTEPIDIKLGGGNG